MNKLKQVKKRGVEGSNAFHQQLTRSSKDSYRGAVLLAWGRGQGLLHRRKCRRRKWIYVTKKEVGQKGKVGGSWAMG